MIDFPEIVKTIYKLNNGIDDELDSNEKLYIADEIHAIYTNTQFKLMELFKHDYFDFHFCINDTAYDVFYCNKEEINEERLLQLIFCNNYIQIFMFKQGDYEHRKIVSEFTSSNHIYCFYDSTVIIIEHKKDNKEYIELDI